MYNTKKIKEPQIKKRPKKKTRINKKILISICICIVIAIIGLIFILTNSEYKAKRMLKKINEPDEMSEGLLMPKYLNRINGKYEGELTTQIMAKTYNNFAENLIPKYYKACKNMTDSELEEYFNQKEKTILIELGYDNSDNFKKFINTISSLNTENLEIEEYRIMRTSVEEKDGYIYAYLSIKYKDNDAIYFNTKLSNTINEKQTSIEYYFDLDEELIEKDNEEEEEFQRDLEIDEPAIERGILIE